MQVTINSRSPEIGPSLRQHLEHRLESALERLSGWVRTATIYLDDINGPRGGQCKRCRVIVAARGIEPVVVTETGHNEFASATRAIRRAKTAIQRRVKQRRDRKTKATRHLPIDTENTSGGNGTAITNPNGATNAFISDRNKKRLRQVITEARHRGIAPPELLRFLDAKLTSMECLPANTMPGDVVTMNSKFRLRETPADDLKTHILCYPDVIGSSNGDLSILAPLGAAILGCRPGDEIIVEDNGSFRRFQLEEVIH